MRTDPEMPEPRIVQMPTEYFRKALETAWLRGWVAGDRSPIDWGVLGDREERAKEAADYAERVVEASTRPE
jgi:hypothetical protein